MAGQWRDGPVWALGLMSGTSMDGVDAAMLLTDGETIAEFGPTAFAAYERVALRALPAVMEDPLRHAKAARPEDRARLAEAEAEVVRLHARAVVDLLSGSELLPALVAFPGQTVAHYPEKGWTWQIGSGARLAAALNRPVVWDFRSPDIAAGGQGAPLAPVFHWAVAKYLGLSAPVAFLNIGGVANITWVDPRADGPEAAGALLAFDTGPGNALVDDWMRQHTGRPLDLGGATAALGRADAVSLETNFVADYLGRPPPKSLDRNAFARLKEIVAPLSAADGAAVLTRFTAACAARAMGHLPGRPTRVLVCGGGRKNPTLMNQLATLLPCEVEPMEAIGLDGDMIEAQAFALLAVRALRGLPTSFPTTTGCPVPISGGRRSDPPTPK
ncbi:MAG: anhydro-N-acetylmuramic acid kinase [Pikeienuella sp.]